MKRRTTHKAFLTIDVLAGLIMLSVLAVILSVGFTQRFRSAARLSNAREAARLAENALLDLRQNPAAKPASPDVVVTPLPEGESQPLRWVTVRATVHGRSVSLVGVVGRRP